MLGLLEKEEALKGTLAKTEKAVELVESSPRPTASTEMPHHLVVFKTRVQEGLDEVNRQRIAAFNSLSLSEVMQTSI